MTTPAVLPDLVLEGRLRRLSILRAAIAGAGLAAFLLTGVREEGFQPFIQPQFHLLAGAALINLVYLGLLKTTLDRRGLLMSQLVIDVLTISGLMFVAGPYTAYPSLFFAIVFLAALVLGGRASIGFAAFSSVFLACISSLYYWLAATIPSLQPAFGEEIAPTVQRLRSWVAQVPLDDYGRPAFILHIVLFIAALHVVAWLANRLAEEISRVRILNDEILVNMADGVIAVDRTGAVVFANPQATELLGMREAPGQLVGRPFVDAFPVEVSALFRKGLQDRDRLQQEIRVGERPIEVSISQLADGVNGVRGAVAIFNDLTLRRQMERVTERAERFRALLEMSAGIAHEIRNPLASIRGAAQELEASALPNEDDRRLMGVVLRESDRLDKIVSEFLEYASDRPVDLALVNVPDLLREVATLLRARAEGKGAELQLDAPPQLVIKCSPDQLKQVFLNLGLNAFDACGADGKVQIRCAPATNPGDPRLGARIEFEDNGPGIPKDDMKRLFSPFFTTKPRGTGMGLAIARKIVTAHGGSIVLDSVEGKGTTARVWLPGA